MKSMASHGDATHLELRYITRKPGPQTTTSQMK